MSCIRIIQITDTHLATPAAPLRGMEQSTEDTLLHVLKSVSKADMDLLLCTGDMTETPDTSTYHKLVELLSPLNAPVYCLPGNHDDPDIAVDSCQDTALSWQKTVDLGPWVIILLDSSLPGVTHGELGNDELQFLQSSLEIYRDRYVLIGLHHHPVKTGSQWMDEIMLHDNELFFTVIDQFPNVRGIVWGHIHQEFDQLRNNARLLGSPSTCRQFKPDETVFIVDEKDPGFREIILHNDGRIETQVIRCA